MTSSSDAYTAEVTGIGEYFLTTPSQRVQGGGKSEGHTGDASQPRKREKYSSRLSSLLVL